MGQLRDSIKQVLKKRKRKRENTTKGSDFKISKQMLKSGTNKFQ